MKEQLKYLLGAILVIPIFPWLYYAAVRTKSKVPKLPNAKNPYGKLGTNDDTFKILFMGESTFAGVGVVDHTENVTGKTAEYLYDLTGKSIEWESIAESGYTVKIVDKILTPKLEGKSFDLCIIGMGGNDTFKLNNPLRWKYNLKKLISSIRSFNPDIPIIITNLPPVGQFPAFPPIMKLIMGGLVKLHQKVICDLPMEIENVHYMTSLIRLQDWAKEYNVPIESFFSDGAHPSALGYKLWGEDIARYIKDHKLIDFNSKSGHQG